MSRAAAAQSIGATLVWVGDTALPPFRVNRLALRLAELLGQRVQLSPRHLYFIGVAAPLATAAETTLRALLPGAQDGAVAPSEDALVTVPRLGTLSPWSSKAGDIARVCDVAGVLRIERGIDWGLSAADRANLLTHPHATGLLFDRMTQSLLPLSDARRLFEVAPARPLVVIELGADRRRRLAEVNRELGLALSTDEIEYLDAAYATLGRDPTDAELMMFAQANSEHCRHKIFNANWIDAEQRPLAEPRSLFQMIRNTFAAQNGRGVLSAYSDNAAVMAGVHTERLLIDPETRQYRFLAEPVHWLAKVETHNHPTAIAPHAGAATGSGGEIRDEGAVGRGSKPKAGLVGYTTSHLRIPGFAQPWEAPAAKPGRIASPLEIMLEAPIGAASFNNEFGRPALTGYFRTLELDVERSDGSREQRGFHKPIMIAGGLGNVRDAHVHAAPVLPGAKLVVLGGPAMLIGLGGGAASSMAQGAGDAELDFASVQRDNAEMQRRCQEVIDVCVALGDDNPIALIHDVGAGGIANALPELVKDGGVGGVFDLRAVACADPALSPMEIWCNESQERYVLAISAARYETFQAICARERCPYACVGEAIAEPRLRVDDAHASAPPVDLPLEVLFGKPPKMTRRYAKTAAPPSALARTLALKCPSALDAVLALPAVASKSFLVTIGDRSITGLVCRDQMVGPWQVPVADVAVTAVGHRTNAGEAMAMGERPALALVDAAASARMAVGEAITNIAAAPIERLADVRLSANWMAAAGTAGEDEALHDAVRAIGTAFCPQLGIVVPVGKDSLSMRSQWQDEAGSHTVTSPMSVIISAFAPVTDVRGVATPWLRTDRGATTLVYVDLGDGAYRLGGSALAQTVNEVGDVVPDIAAERLSAFFAVLQRLHADGVVLAYHDRSDGGLVVALLEMAFAGRCGLAIALPEGAASDLAVLFAEELGAVLQVPARDAANVCAAFAAGGVRALAIGAPAEGDVVRIQRGDRTLLEAPRTRLQERWSEVSFRMQSLRDDPQCAREEFEAIGVDDPGMRATLSFDLAALPAPAILRGRAPKVAVLREQGVNGHAEMAAAFLRAGFEPIDVHMTDLIDGAQTLDRFDALVACGGFSYGDVLGAGAGWAKSILFHGATRERFVRFFERPTTLTLGICNGCQMLAHLRQLIPGAAHWPRFLRNRSEQFEARQVLVRIEQNNSPWLAGMSGSVLPVVVAHGEGRAVLGDSIPAQSAASQVALRYVDTTHAPTQRYPANPNGSYDAIAGVQSLDGRALIMMPHPERVTRAVTNSWRPDSWGEDGPWVKLFVNAREAV